MLRTLLISFLLITSSSELLAQGIVEATETGDTAQVSNLLKDDPTLVDFMDDGGWSPLRVAASENNVEMIELLLASGAEIDKMAGDNTAFFEAASKGNVDALKALLTAGADIEIRNTNLDTPLMASGQNIEVMTLLLDAGADIEAHRGNGRTHLSLVTRRGYKDAVNFLLARGAAVSIEGWTGRHLVQGAIKNGLITLLEHLIAAGADLDFSSTDGGTMVHLAAIGGSPVIIHMLIDRGGNPGSKDRYGYTPLHYAASNGFPDVISYLLSKEVDIDPLNAAGQSPLSLANKYSHEESATVLRDAGATKENSEFPKRTGDYLGEEPPEGVARLFAPGIVSSHRFEHSTVVFSPDGNEATWSSGFNQPTRGMRLLTSRRVNGVWSEPQLIPPPPLDSPFYTSNGKRFYYHSNEPIEGEERPFGNGRIWYSERTDDGWSEPIVVKGGPNNYQKWWNFTVADNGDIYFSSNAEEGFGRTDIYYSRIVNGRYLSRENPGLNINSKAMDVNPYIAPDGSFLLFASDKEGGLGALDIYVSWRQENGEWGEAENLGPGVNSTEQDGTPIISHDGKYLFFGSFTSGNRDNYWIDVASVPALNRPW